MTTRQADERPWAVVGLGNPGTRYAGTRHNIGFMVVDALAARHGITLSDRREHAALGQGAMGGARVVLAKPRTFVNNSGVAVRYLCQRFHVPLTRLLIVLDDMDLPAGRLRLRASGSSGGHNGLNSITAVLGSQDYARLRVGIGRPGFEAIPHVLGRFAPEEAPLIAETIDRASEAVEACVLHGVSHAMNTFNA